MANTSSIVTGQYVPGISIFAQLLANENIQVVVDHAAETAYFEPVSRKLTLPSWKDFSSDAWLLFIAHEVGHALYTPQNALTVDEFKKLCATYGENAAMIILNILEDIRIERKVRTHYRGLDGIFARGYKSLMDAKFFGFQTITQAEFLARTVVDQLNIYSKAGSLLNVRLMDNRFIVWYNRALAIETYDEVLTLASEMLRVLMDEYKEQLNKAASGSSANSQQSNQKGKSSDSRSSRPGQSSQSAQSGQSNQSAQSGQSSQSADNGSETDGGSDGSDGSGAGVNGEQDSDETGSRNDAKASGTDEKQGNGSQSQDMNQDGEDSPDGGSGGGNADGSQNDASSDADTASSESGAGNGAPAPMNPFTSQSMDSANRMMKTNRNTYGYNSETIIMPTNMPKPVIVSATSLLEEWGQKIVDNNYLNW